MKINELMIGDWVQVPSLIDNIEHYDAWCKVKQLRDCDLDVVGFKELNYKEIVPIPLTSEILEKNGWEKCNIDVVDDDEQYGCAYGPFYFTWWRKVKLLSCYFDDMNAGLHYEMISELPTKYVHQLQHALKLCKIEKEIEL